MTLKQEWITENPAVYEHGKNRKENGMNLLVTGAFAWAEEELNRLKQLGHETVFMQNEKGPLSCDATWVEGIIGNGIFLSHPIEKFTSLRYIQLTSAGFDRVPMNYVKEHNIDIFNARGVYSIPMAEFAVSGVLAFYKNSRLFDENQEAHKWIKNRTVRELYEKTVCIVGCGSVGTECALRFKAFGCRVFGVDLQPYQSDAYEAMAPLNELDSILAHSDVVVLCLPLTEQTRHLMNADRFSKMQNGAIVVNISRGRIVDTQALIEALKANRFYAVLDVFEDEPLDESSPLWDLQNVIITPHNSFVGDGNHRRMLNVIMENLQRSGKNK